MPHEEEQSVSVVVCAYTSARWVQLCALITSLERQTVSPAEVILVIDHNDELLAHAREQFRSVQVIPNTSQPGAGGARNEGVQLALGDIIGFIDDDAEADVQWIAQLLAQMDSDRVLGVGGTIEPNWEDHQPRWFPDEFNWVVGCTYPGLPTNPSPVRNLIGANMSIRREAFQAAGGFRTGFGNVKGRARSGWLRTVARSGDEETELCIRASGMHPGGVWIFNPQMRVSHFVPSFRGRLGYFISRCYDEGLGKAAISSLVGSGTGLESERRYTRRTLPRGIVRNLVGSARHADPWGIARAAAILVGLTSAVIGYGVGSTAAKVRSSENAVERP